MFLASHTELPLDKRAADVAIYGPDGVQLSGFDPSRPANAALSNVAMTNASSVIAAANVNRRALIIVNSSGKNLFVAFAPTASATAYTYSVANGNQVEIPLGGYTGVVSGVLASGAGTIRVTEVTT